MLANVPFSKIRKRCTTDEKSAGVWAGLHTILELDCDALIVEFHQEANELHDVKASGCILVVGEEGGDKPGARNR